MHRIDEKPQATILIVDDDPENLRVLSSILKEAGYQARLLREASLVLASAANAAPDLILLDIMMPDLDGYQACQQLKADERASDIPVIFLSALDGSTDKVKAFAAGGVDYVTKPFQVEEILARVRGHVSLHQAQQQLQTRNRQLQQEIALRQQAEAELQQSHSLLEERVAARTAELSRANQRLRAEIADRKRAEEALQANTAQLKGILDNLQDAYFQADTSGALTMANPAALRMYGYGSFSELLGHPAQNLYADSNDRDALLAELRKSQHVTDMIVRGRRKDGSTFWVSMNVQFVRDREGCVIGTEGVVRDISERKHAEEQIEQALREKETLLRELYHRTKNNMQVIRSMLMLRAATCHNGDIAAFVREIDQKILCMALVHQKLYQAQDLSWISLDNYVAELAALIMQSESNSAANIALDLDLEPVRVLLDTATPCGLVVHELISNALKHAFPDTRAGEIRIRLRRAPDSAIELDVADNGVGTPAGFDLDAQPTLGLQTVAALVKNQMQGDIHVHGQRGLAYAIRFKDNLYSARV